MRVLVACEFSGIVRRAFDRAGHDAWSCDLLPSERGGQHILWDAIQTAFDPKWKWELMIAFPPCTHLAVSGARWFKDKRDEQYYALQFVERLLDAPIPRIALENPIGIISTRIRKPDQIIQPWQFGHGETKATCLWLESAQARPNQYRERTRGPCAPRIARSRPLEGAQPHAAWYCSSNGRAVGQPAHGGGVSWAIGYDENWHRDIGYGVPAPCDYPGCEAEIDRGLSYVCGGEPFGGDDGCGLYFCAKHLSAAESLCERCRNGRGPFEPKPDLPRWIAHKATDPSWAAWRAENK